MTLQTSITTLGLIIAINACSIKETREDCPCMLVIDLSDASEDGGTIQISTWNGDDSIVHRELNAKTDRTFTCRVPKGTVSISAMQGLNRCVADDRSVMIPEGNDCDRIMVYSGKADCRGENEYAKARFVKNWASLTLEYSCPQDGEYPFSFVITGGICGFDPLTLAPIKGNFRCTADTDESGRNSCVQNIPRQSPEHDDCQLRLHILSKSDGKEVLSYNLSEIIAGTGYSWSSDSLDDICIGLDYSGTITGITVTDWETGSTNDIII